MRPQRAAAATALRTLFKGIVQESSEEETTTTDEKSEDSKTSSEKESEDDASSEEESEEDVILDHDSEESDISDEEPPLPQPMNDLVLSHDLHEQWQRQPLLQQGARHRLHNIIRTAPGPTKVVANQCATVERSFRCFFTDEICDFIVGHTNAEGRRISGDTRRDISSAELRTYLGLLLLAGVYLGNREPLIHLWNRKNGRLIFSQAMSRNRFTTITQCLRFNDKGNAPWAARSG